MLVLRVLVTFLSEEVVLSDCLFSHSYGFISKEYIFLFIAFWYTSLHYCYCSILGNKTMFFNLDMFRH